MPYSFPFPHALSGPFDDLGPAGLSAFRTLCGAITHRYLRFNGFIRLHLLYHSPRTFVNSQSAFLYTNIQSHIHLTKISMTSDPNLKDQLPNLHVIARSRQATWQSRGPWNSSENLRDCHGPMGLAMTWQSGAGPSIFRFWVAERLRGVEGAAPYKHNGSPIVEDGPLDVPPPQRGEKNRCRWHHVWGQKMPPVCTGG